MLQVTGRAALRCSPRPRGPCGRRRGRRASPPCQAGGSAPCHPARWAPCGQESTSLCRAAPGDEPASQTRTILRKAEVAPRAAWQLCGLHAGLQGGVGGRWVLWGQDAGAGAGHPCTTGSKGQLPTAPSAESCARKPPRHVRWPSACPHDPGDTHLPVPGVCRRGGPPTCTCIHVRTHAHAHMRTHIHAHTHAHTHVHPHTCTDVRTCTHMYPRAGGCSAGSADAGAASAWPSPAPLPGPHTTPFCRGNRDLSVRCHLDYVPVASRTGSERRA